MTSFFGQTQQSEEQGQRMPPGGNAAPPTPDARRQMQNARSYVPPSPGNGAGNSHVPPSQPYRSPNPASINHGGSQGFGRNPATNGLGLLQRVRGTQAPLEVEGNNLILHRSQHFYLRTAYTPGQTVAPFRRPSGHTTTIPKILPQQGDRVASSTTRALPKLTEINPINKKGRLSIPRWLETVAILIGLLMVGVVHAFNMFNFPRYELDEGTYMSNAWAILHDQISPYAYGYGHPPLSWMQIAFWVQLTGGFFTFGNAINTGRVLMLLYSLGSALLVYLILRRFGASRSAGLLAVVLFALSPLAITFQREVLLDNVATFWLLLSLYLLVVGNSRLLYVVLSAVALGISILSKEVMLLFIPGMIYAAWLHTTQFQRKFAVVAFIYSLLAVGSTFVLMALLRGELFPAAWHLPWDHSPHHQHLSLLDTYLAQAQRTQGEGPFSQSFAAWWIADKVLIGGSILATVFNLLMGWWNRKQLLLALLAICFWALLIRGGVVLSFYVIPLIPLMAINMAMAIHTIMNWIGRMVRLDVVRVLLILGVIAVIIPYDMFNTNTKNIFTLHPTSAQNQAITWVRQHVPHDDFIVINSYLYMELREPNGIGVGDGAAYPYAHVYQNAATDPTIAFDLLHNDWNNVNYIIADSEMLSDINAQRGKYWILAGALDHSVIDAQFSTPDEKGSIVITIYEVQHKSAPPIVMKTTPNSNGSRASRASIARGTMPADRRLYTV